MKKLITPEDNVIAPQPEPFVYWCITTVMPKTNPETGQPVLDVMKNPIYETNYFCRRMKQLNTGLVFIEWDTDHSYAQRFRSEVGANNYLTVVLKEQNCVISKHPLSL